MLKRSVLLVYCAFWVTNIFAQKQSQNWYFGDYAGISFASGSPVALTNGYISSGEGCSTISDEEGNLMFYTDGVRVWNKNHQVMESGSGLHGHTSSTQSALIVSNPANPDIYYIFTTDARDNNLTYGLQYSVVDMSANGGLGRVDPEQKNIQLVAPTCEKVTAIGNASGNGYWVVTHEWGSNSFYAYSVLASGVVNFPVVSNVGEVIDGDLENSKGYLKISPDGKTLAAAHNRLLLVEIFDFNTATGLVSNPISDYDYMNYGGNDPGGPYGVEFSPDSKKLYIGEWKVGHKIFQYDLDAGSAQQILDSRHAIATVGLAAAPIGGMQLGVDKRIYIARSNESYLSRINFPDTTGMGCGFEDVAVSLNGRESTYGLTAFNQSLFFLVTEFDWETPACDGTPVSFHEALTYTADSVRWNFGDPGSGWLNTSTSLNPAHLYPSPGSYQVTFTAYLYGSGEAVEKTVVVYEQPDIFIGNDTVLCTGEPLLLDAGGGYVNYLWQNGDSNQTFLATFTGLYWCEVTGEGGCTDRDSISLVLFPPSLSAPVLIR